MIARESIQKIMDYAQIEDVVSDFVTLKRRGTSLVGLCPFHDEKTPSFTVTPAKNIFKCFGCGKGGDPVNFVMEHEHLSYPEALRHLAQKYNIELEETRQTEEALEEQSERESMLIALKFATGYFENQLWETEMGRAIGYSYFKERGLSDDTIKAFQLGYAADSYSALLEAAKQNEFEEKVLVSVGLLKEKEGRTYDFFRDRVMFPVHNIAGKVIAFGGRILKKEDNIAKYINTPETDLYQKSKVLYGFYQAKNEIRKKDECILVEGYMDVIMLFQAGIKNAVASSGTSLTTDQIRLIHRFTDNIVILYDGDPAGIKAAIRGLDMLLEQGMNVKVVVLPDKHDPDSYVQEAGAQGMLDFISSHKKDFIYFKASLAMEDAKSDPVAKSRLIRDIVTSIALIQDPIKRMVYIQELARMMQVSEQVLIVEVNKIKRAWLKHQSQPGERTAVEDLQEDVLQSADQRTYDLTIEHQEKDIIRVLLEHAEKPWEDDIPVAGYILVNLEKIILNNPLLQVVISKAKEMFEGHHSLDQLRDADKYDDPAIRKLIIELLVSPYELSHNWLSRHDIIVTMTEHNYRDDVESALTRFKLVKVLEYMSVYDEKIRIALDVNEQMNLLGARKILQDEKQSLSAKLGSVIIR